MSGLRELNDPPLVSICVPTYNRRHLLEETLRTLKKQTYSNFELIVCDDSSTDGTLEFLDSLSWPNLRILRNSSNLNLPGTMARLFREARGTYIGMQHDHDLYKPEFLEKMVELMESHTTAGFACSAFYVMNSNGKVFEPPSTWFGFYSESGIRSGKEMVNVLASETSTPIPAMGTIFRREVVERAGGYRPDWYLASDEDLYRRVAAISDVAFTRELLFTMRVRPSDRHSILGSWKGIYTLHEFRIDTTKRSTDWGGFRKRINLLRLWGIRLAALLRECVSLSIQGKFQELKGAIDVRSVPSLPTGGPTLSTPEKMLLRLCILFLRVIYQPLRQIIGRLSRSAKCESA